jgi:S1-C subfamily serine protease
MRRLMAPLIIAVTLMGCKSPYVAPNDAQRVTSFRSFADERIGGQTAGEYLFARTAVLLSGAPLAAIRVDGASAVLTFHDPNAGQANGLFALGTGHAAVVDTRGYLLTAGHVVTASNLYLIYYLNGIPHVVVPRLAARKDDVALLHIPAQLTDNFPIARNDPPAGTNLLALGFTEPKARSETVRELVPEALAGAVVGVHVMGPAMAAVVAQMPIRRGDSGGALITPNGEMVGIVCRAYNDGGNRTDVIALQPSQDWVNAQIASDHTAAIPDPPMPSLPASSADTNLPVLVVSPEQAGK